MCVSISFVSLYRMCLYLTCVSLCQQAKDGCLKALKDRLIDRAHIIETRLEEEQAALTKRQVCVCVCVCVSVCIYTALTKRQMPVYLTCVFISHESLSHMCPYLISYSESCLLHESCLL